MLTETQFKDVYFKKADDVKNMEDFKNLFDEVQGEQLDYGSVVYACYVMMKAGFNLINRSDKGGITGFQAGFIGWEVVRDFMGVRGPAKILSYENLLYPQYDSNFNKTIEEETFNHIKDLAKKNLEKYHSSAHDSVVERWKLIASGNLPNGFLIEKQ